MDSRRGETITHSVPIYTEANRASDPDTITNYTQQHRTEAHKTRINGGDSFINIKYIIETAKAKSADWYFKESFQNF